MAPGDFVLVPFGPQTRLGVVWDRLLGRPARQRAEEDEGARRAARRAGAAGAVAAVRRVDRALHAGAGRHGGAHDDGRAVSAFEPVKPRFGVCIADASAAPPRLTPARKRALEVAADGLPRAKSALAAEAQCSTGVIDGLVEAGLLVEVVIPERRYPVPRADHAENQFTDAQAQAVHLLRAAVDADAYSVTLLDGVTGSGKTEVYFEAVARALAQGRQALIMLPEIALTSQFMSRFQKRFGAPPVEWHSALSAAGARARLAGGGDRRGARRGRRALGAVPALPGSRPDHRRRGARPGLQAGGPRPLSGARHGGGARQPRQDPGHAGVGDAVDREPRQRAHAALSPCRAAGPVLGRRDAGGQRDRPAPRAAGARQVAGAAAGRRPSRRRCRKASRRCCSSTGAAMRR